MSEQTSAAGATNGLSGRTTIVVGASRGLGLGVATALAGAGASVISVARTPEPASSVTAGPGTIEAVAADAGAAASADRLLGRYEPDTVVLVAGARPHMRPLQEQTWETFSVNWESDVRIAFLWLREALRKPLRPGSRVVVFSSGAAVRGSQLSGGYAGAKATQRFLATYAQAEAQRANLDIAFTAVLPRLTPHTDLGRPAVEAYAARNRQTVDEYVQTLGGEPLTPATAGAAVVELAGADATTLAPSYLLTGAGLQPLD